MCSSFAQISFVVLCVFVLGGSSKVADYDVLCLNALRFGLSTFKKCLFEHGFNEKCDFETIAEPTEIIVSPGDNVTLSCAQYSEKAYWYHPWRGGAKNTFRMREDYARKVSKFFSGFVWRVKTFLPDVNYALTGLYSCFSGFHNPCRYVEQHYYLYVRDENILSVYNTRMFSNDYVVTQYESFEIKCIPTSSDVVVDLFIRTSADEELQQKIVLNTLGENHVIYTYDPYRGFNTNDTLVVGVKIYTCKFSRNSKEENITSRIIIKPLNTTVPEPKMETYNENAIGERLTLRCTLKTKKNITIEWLTPQTPSDPRIQTVSESKSLEVSNEITSSFSLKELNTSDSGVYYCIAKYKNVDFSINQTIVLPQEYFITFIGSTSTITDLLSRKTGVTAELHIQYESYPPEPDMYWLKDGKRIAPESLPKISVQFTNEYAHLKIINVSETDFGMYNLVARNSKITREISLRFNKFYLHDAVINVVDLDLGLVQCIAAAYPTPSVSWYFKSNHNNDVRSFQQISESHSEHNGFQVTSYIKINSTSSGQLMCIAINVNNKQNLVFQEVENPKNDFEIRGPNIVYSNDGKMRIDVNIYANITLGCVVSLYNYTENMLWTNTHTYSGELKVEHFNAMYSKHLKLTFYNISTDAEDYYTCQVLTKNNISHYRNIQVVVGDNKIFPSITYTNLATDIKELLYREFNLYCNVTGFPSPNVSWIKDNIILESSEKFKITNYNQSLLIKNFTENEFGVYRCEAVNSEGTVYKLFYLKPDSSFISDYWYVLLLITIMMLVPSLFLIFTIFKMRNYKKVMKMMSLDNFEKGALDKLNPELQLNEQADALPYDAKWEVPVKNIKLGEKLGSGAFGIVTKGELKSKNQNGLHYSIHVAVKTFRKGSDLTCLKALASELKIMANLGSHLNIVNLLGACTKNIAKCKLLVIFEYCQFGNLHKYLHNHKHNYINQIDSAGQVDYSIGQDILQRRSVLLNTKSSERCATMRLEEPPELYGSSEKLEEVPNVEDAQFKCDQEEYQNIVTHVCTKDLIAWGFQVARGMEYLSSCKVFHGDLAANNILLTTNNIVKICNIGLAKNLYHTEIYKKTHQGLPPMKWMALESIASNIFSTWSDVWSFGVVLWEFFTLADTPYPTMQVDEEFFRKLSEGYRLESPEFAPKELYKIMLDCWRADPLLRPSFAELADRIGMMLEKSDKNHYLDMNKTCAPSYENTWLPGHNYANFPQAKENSSDFPIEVKTKEDPDKCNASNKCSTVNTTTREGLSNPSYSSLSDLRLTENCDIVEAVETTCM